MPLMGHIGPGRAFCSLGQAWPGRYMCAPHRAGPGRAGPKFCRAEHFRPVQSTRHDIRAVSVRQSRWDPGIRGLGIRQSRIPALKNQVRDQCRIKLLGGPVPNADGGPCPLSLPSPYPCRIPNSLPFKVGLVPIDIMMTSALILTI